MFSFIQKTHIRNSINLWAHLTWSSSPVIDQNLPLPLCRRSQKTCADSSACRRGILRHLFLQIEGFQKKFRDLKSRCIYVLIQNFRRSKIPMQEKCTRSHLAWCVDPKSTVHVRILVLVAYLNKETIDLFSLGGLSSHFRPRDDTLEDSCFQILNDRMYMKE